MRAGVAVGMTGGSRAAWVPDIRPVRVSRHLPGRRSCR